MIGSGMRWSEDGGRKKRVQSTKDQGGRWWCGGGWCEGEGDEDEEEDEDERHEYGRGWR